MTPRNVALAFKPSPWELARANVEESSVRHRLQSASRRIGVLAAVLAFASIVGAGGCADQAEGERCTYFMGGDAGENGTSECAAGLICKPTSYYGTSNPTTVGVGTFGVCCPPSGTSSAPACTPPVGGSTTGGRTTGDGSFDAGVDATKADATKGDAAKSDATKSDAASDATGSDALSAGDAKKG